jgi:branched-subunit amino acid ABC-type transport system permease component
LHGTISVFGDPFPKYRLLVAAVCLAIALVIWFLTERTWLGLVVRATAADQEMIAALGVDPRRVVLGVFAAAAGLAMLAGALNAPTAGPGPGEDVQILLPALVVVVIGGLGSIGGTLVGALVVGQVETLGRSLLPDQASFLLFSAMAITLVLRPQGLLGGRAFIDSH